MRRHDNQNDTAICQLYDEKCLFDYEDLHITNETCQHSRTCLLYFNSTTSCLQKYGLIDITYTCKEPTNYNCNFENRSCNWSSLSMWTLASTYQDEIGNDVTTGKAYGHFIYINSKNSAGQVQANLTSGYIVSNEIKCLTFWYQIKSNNNQQHQASLIVFQRGNTITKYVVNNTQVTNNWVKAVFQLALYDVYAIVIKATVEQGTIALDDIDMFDGLCSGNNNSVCNFENDNENCNWITNSSDNILNWTRGSVITFHPGILDHTTNTENGHYMYIMTWWDSGNGSVRIKHTTSRRMTCFSFWYYIFGDFIDFNVYQEFNHSKLANISSINITNSYTWHRYAETLLVNRTFWLILRVNFPTFTSTQSTGNNSLRLVVVDDVSFTDGPCPGDQMISHECLRIDKQFRIKECSANDLVNKSFYIDLPGVNDELPFDVNRIETLCKEAYGTRQCSFTPSTFLLTDAYKCFIFNNTQHLLVNHSCLELASSSTKPNTVSTTTDTSTSPIVVGTGIGSSTSPIAVSTGTGVPDGVVQSQNTSKITGIIVGVVVGIGFVFGFVTILLCYIRRSKSVRTESAGLDNAMLTNDYTGHQSVALPTLPMSNSDGYTEIQTKNDNYQHVNYQPKTSINTSVPNYAKLNKLQKSFYNKAGHSLHANDVTNHDYIYLDETQAECTQTSMNGPNVSRLNQEIHNSHVVIDPNDDLLSGTDRQTKPSMSPPGNYAILDPNETGFFRSIGNNETTTEYEFAVPINNSERASDLQDPYSVSENGAYDTTDKVRHKEADTNIYSHAIENMYDTSSHERQIEDNDGTYDHFFGDTTENNYNITQRK